MVLWCKHRFRVDTLARGAGVPEDTIYTMLRFRPVAPCDAAKVLAELGRIYERDYTFETVWVSLLEERPCTS
jgi:hypothetical protein